MIRASKGFIVVLVLLALALFPTAAAQQAFAGTRVGYSLLGFSFGAVGGAYFTEIIGIRSTFDVSFPSGIFVGRLGVDILGRIPTRTVIEPYFGLGPALLFATYGGVSDIAFGGGAVVGVEFVAVPQVGIVMEGGLDIWFGGSVLVLGKGNVGVNFRF